MFFSQQSLQQFLKERKWEAIASKKELPLQFLVTHQKEASDPSPKAQVKHLPVYLTWMALSASVALVVNNMPDNAGDARDAGSTPGSGRSPGGGNGNPVQYSCLENPMDRGGWQVTVRVSQRVGHDWAWLSMQHVYGRCQTFWEASRSCHCWGEEGRGTDLYSLFTVHPEGVCFYLFHLCIHIRYFWTKDFIC